MPASGKKIVVVGSINMDLVSQVSRFPQPGETVRGRAFAMHPGGKGANQAVAAARLAHPVQMIGMVGKDAFGAELRSRLEREGVDAAEIGIAEGPTGTAAILVDPQGENSIVVCAGANDAVTPELLESKAEVISSAGMVLAQLEIPIESIERLAAICARAGVPLMLDPAPAAPLPEAVLSRLAWMTPNEAEAAFYAPDAREPAERAAALRKLGPANVLLKRGPAGSTVADAGGSILHLPARAVRSVDATAAGDCFNAAFAAALLEGLNPERAARFASAAAALSVTRAGAQASLPFRAEVDRMLAE